MSGSFSCLFHSISDAISLLISGGTVPNNACISLTEINLKHPEIILQVSFNAISTFLHDIIWPIRRQHIRLLSNVKLVLIFLQYLGQLPTMFL